MARLIQIEILNPTLMDTFSGLSWRAKTLVIMCSVFLLSLSVSLLVFGGDIVTYENAFIEQAQDSIRADMLYSAPGGH